MRIQFLGSWAVSVAAITVVGCGPANSSSDAGTDAGGSSADAGPPTFSSIQTNIFNVSCNNASCHSPSGESISGKLNLAPDASYVSLLGADGGGAHIPDTSDPGEVKANSMGYLLVDPGNPTNSFLYLKVAPGLDSSFGAQMPNLGTALSDAQVQVIHDWIAAGALNN